MNKMSSFNVTINDFKTKSKFSRLTDMVIDTIVYSKLSINPGIYGIYYAIAKMAPLPPVKFMAAATAANLAVSFMVNDRRVYNKKIVNDSLITHELSI